MLITKCAWCGRLRDRSGNWSRCDSLLQTGTVEGLVTHTICMECIQVVAPDVYEELKDKPGLLIGEDKWERGLL